MKNRRNARTEILAVLADGHWHTAPDIKVITGLSAAAVNDQLRTMVRGRLVVRVGPTRTPETGGSGLSEIAVRTGPVLAVFWYRLHHLTIVTDTG